MPIPWLTRVNLMLRGLPVGRIQSAYAQAERHRLPVTVDQLVAHQRAGGTIEDVIATAIDAPRENIEENMRKLFGADLAGQDLRAFVARGFMTEQEWELVRLRAAAQHDPDAARKYRAYLVESIASLDQAARRYAASELPARYKDEAAKNFPLKRAQYEGEIADLESKFPELRGE